MRRNRKRNVHAKVVPRSVAGVFLLMIGLVLLYWMKSRDYKLAAA